MRPIDNRGNRAATVNESLHPTEGIRLLLDREEVTDDRSGATYRASIYTVDACFVYRAELGLDGSCALRPEGQEAPDEDRATLEKISKSTARAAKRKLDEMLPPWPPRILRWRGPGRG